MNLVNLDETTRRYMLEEIELDTTEGKLYYSKRLTAKGRSDYEGALREAVQNHDADWLADQLNREGRMHGVEVARSKRGRVYPKRTPSGDHLTVAYGEFNRFYIRGLCARAIAEGIDHLIVYRAREVRVARRRSMAKLGSHVDPQNLLDDLRENIGRATRLGIPGGPNSGISVKLPERNSQ